MLRSLTLATPCLAALLAANPCHAFTITPLGPITGTAFDDTRAFKHDLATDPIDDYYTFTTTGITNISASITNSFSSSKQYIDGFTIQLFSGLPPSTGQTAIASGTNSVINDPPDSENAKLRALNQMAGNYYLEVTGTTMGTPSYSGSLAVTLTNMPLPASAPMFGAGLIALGGVGYVAKRKMAATAA